MFTIPQKIKLCCGGYEIVTLTVGYILQLKVISVSSNGVVPGNMTDVVN